MQHYIICPKSGGLFLFSNFNEATTQTLLASSALYKVIYNRGEATQVYINNSSAMVGKGEVLFCKPLQCVEVSNPQTGLQVIAFNKDFYNLKTVDEEKEFYGFWFFGFKHSLIITLNEIEQNFYNVIFNNIEQELNYTNGSTVTQRDILKRIIRITSIKIQTPAKKVIVENLQLDIVKRFSQLIEAHFKKKTSFVDIVKEQSKNSSFLHQLFGRFFSKPSASEKGSVTKEEQFYNSGIHIKSGIAAKSGAAFGNSKLKTKGTVPLFPQTERRLNA